MNSAPAYYGTKESSWQLRQQDTGWGRAIAHIIPGYGLYYACQRRTLTPLLINLVGGFSLGLIVGLVGANASEAQKETAGLLLGITATPFLTKKGIDMARKDGEMRLKGIHLNPLTGISTSVSNKVTGTVYSSVPVTQSSSN